MSDYTEFLESKRVTAPAVGFDVAEADLLRRLLEPDAGDTQKAEPVGGGRRQRSPVGLKGQAMTWRTLWRLPLATAAWTATRWEIPLRR